jgi:hypothetical protein
MVKHASIPNSLWQEAITTITYVQNCFPTKAILQMTPYELWHGAN